MAPAVVSTSDLSPLAIAHLDRRQDDAAQKFIHGQGTTSASAVSGVGFQVLFALIGAGMVLASLWFFFWAKNGGFKWRKGDWEDYKSTVLRRKGPDGKTLSNATKSTKLGGGSVVHGGSYGNSEHTLSSGYTDKDEMREDDGPGLRGGGGTHAGRYNNRKSRTKDPELAEYRQEKVARVGGINRQHDGSYFDYSNTEPSVVSSDLSQQPLVKDKRKPLPKDDKKKAAQREKDRKVAEKEAQKVKAAEEKRAREAAQREMKELNKQRAQLLKAQQEKAKAAKKGKKDGKDSKAAYSKAPSSSKHNTPESTPTKPATTHRSHRPAPSEYTYTTVSDDRDETRTQYTAAYTEYSSPSQQRSPASQRTPSSYYDAYRPRNTPTRTNDAPSRGHSQSPRKPQSARRVVSEHDWAIEAASDTGTKAYQHYIPGLSSAGSVAAGDSVSQAGARSQGRTRAGGYRRGRRDSLSDSEM